MAISQDSYIWCLDTNTSEYQMLKGMWPLSSCPAFKFPNGTCLVYWKRDDELDGSLKVLSSRLFSYSYIFARIHLSYLWKAYKKHYWDEFWEIIPHTFLTRGIIHWQSITGVMPCWDLWLRIDSLQPADKSPHNVKVELSNLQLIIPHWHFTRQIRMKKRKKRIKSMSSAQQHCNPNEHGAEMNRWVNFQGTEGELIWSVKEIR